MTKIRLGRSTLRRRTGITALSVLIASAGLLVAAPVSADINNPTQLENCANAPDTICVYPLPQNAAAGTTIEVTGRGLSAVLAADGSIWFGNQSAPVIAYDPPSDSWTDQTVEVTVPSQSDGVSTVDVILSGSGGEAWLLGTYSYPAPPPSGDPATPVNVGDMPNTIEIELCLRAGYDYAYKHSGENLSREEARAVWDTRLVFISDAVRRKTVQASVSTIIPTLTPSQRGDFLSLFSECLVKIGYPLQSLPSVNTDTKNPRTATRNEFVSGKITYTVNGRVLCSAKVSGVASSCSGKVKRFKGNAQIATTFIGDIAGIPITLDYAAKPIKASRLFVSKANLTNKGNKRILTLQGIGSNAAKPVKVFLKAGRGFQLISTLKTANRNTWKLKKSYSKHKLKDKPVTIRVRHAGETLTFRV